jgi:Nif-specific regulatory protein
VRELENAIERAVVLDTDLQIGEDDLMFSIGKDKSAGIEAGLTLEKLSKKLLEKTLRAVDFNKTKAAEMMGVSLRWIHYKMKEWNLN